MYESWRRVPLARPIINFFIGLPLVLALPACTNNLTFNAPLSLPSDSNLVPPQDGTIGGGTGTNKGGFVLSRVVKNSLAPTQTLDLLGDGSGTFGRFCQSLNPSAANTAKSQSVCNCRLTFSSPTRLNQVTDVPIDYHETDLLRCNYTVIPSDATSFSVAVHLSTADILTNGVTLSGTASGSTLDLSNKNSFVKPIRYQCRDIIKINYQLDPLTIYDPFQSEDPHLTYPLNYYTSNIYTAVTSYIQAQQDNNVTEFDCPPVLTPNETLSSTAATAFIQANHMNLQIFSRGPASNGGGKSISPYVAGFDRSSFYVAKQASGIFDVPLNAYIAPTVVSSKPALNSTSDPLHPAPLGFGVRPGTGNGAESCPSASAVTVPTGYKWVKVWLYRAGLAPRHFASSPDIAAISSISCNPGDFDTAGAVTVNNKPQQPFFASCPLTATNAVGGNTSPYDKDKPSTYSLSMVELGSVVDVPSAVTINLVDRVLGGAGGQCLHLQQSKAAPCILASSSGAACKKLSSSSDLAELFDMWQVVVPDAVTYKDSISFGCSKVASPSNSKVDNLNICSNSLTAADNPGPTAVSPTSYRLTVNEVDRAPQGASNPNPRYDFLFVVTPPEVTVQAMLDTSASSPTLQYQPYRFLTSNDCTTDPDNPIVGDCLSKNLINTYGLKFHDIGLNGDPAGNVPNADPNNTRGGVFPFCALQPENP